MIPGSPPKIPAISGFANHREANERTVPGTRLLIGETRDPGRDFEAEPVAVEVQDGFVTLKDDTGRELRIDCQDLAQVLRS